MSSLPALAQTPQSNAKRYWGEEKNIDSIYSIYLKKICYTNNNDLLSSDGSNVTNRRNSQDSRSSIASSSDLARFAAQAINDSCQKETPRGRKNFFQKYRRRSCSMDKYSFYKLHKSNSATNTPNNTSIINSSKKASKMRYESPSKKANQLVNDAISYDDLDGSLSASSKVQSHKDGDIGVNVGLQKSMNDVSQYAQAQSLQWETRQIRILQAATLDHVLKFMLLINSAKDISNANSDVSSSVGDCALDEERNNVAHTIHVFFCTYRIYTNPYELMLKLMDYSDICRVDQYRFVMHYWMDNYPEDFEYIVECPENCDSSQKGQSISSTRNISRATPSVNSHNNSITSYDSSVTTRTAATSDSENSAEAIRALDNGNATIRSASSQSGGSDNLDRRLSNLSIGTNNDNDKSGVLLFEELLRLCRDDYIRNKVSKLNELRAMTSGCISSGPDSDTSRRAKPGSSSKNSAILDLDSRYVAQQLTAIDLENFLQLRPYSLLEGTRSDKRIQRMIKNFNLLSRHVVVTILKSHNPHIVAAHWIAIAMNLRKIKNFNSLKAIIAGLTNESIYRLKQLIWSKLDRSSSTNFKIMASIVDDVNNQIVLRQTQLVVEGTAKMSIEDDSFGTIPYLGTFLTDLNMIDARYPTYVPSPKDETSKLKLINFEKCAKQFEILTQVQLLQKNVLASIHALQRRNHFDEQTTLNRLKLEFDKNRQILATKPAIPKVARLFENWFYDSTVASMTDKQW